VKSSTSKNSGKKPTQSSLAAPRIDG
jgi:hypothetical protein